MSVPIAVARSHPVAVARSHPVAELTDWLHGAWTIARVINDGAGRFDGCARFTADPDSPDALIWHEHGRLRLGAHDGPAERTLRIDAIDVGTAEVRFVDGRPFHRVDLVTGSCELTHHCGGDTYRGRYEVHTRDRFSVTWRVTGPHKDDVIKSLYERAA